MYYQTLYGKHIERNILNNIIIHEYHLIDARFAFFYLVYNFYTLRLMYILL